MSLIPVNTRLARCFRCFRRNAVEVWCKTLFPAGLVEAASLVSGGRLPVLARQLSRHQDCKSTLLRLWQKHLPSILLQCTVSFFTCANHYCTVCATVRLCRDFFLAAAIVVPLVTKVLGEVHILLLTRSVLCSSHGGCSRVWGPTLRYSQIKGIQNITVSRGSLCVSVPICQAFDIWYFFNIIEEIADGVAYSSLNVFQYYAAMLWCCYLAVFCFQTSLWECVHVTFYTVNWLSWKNTNKLSDYQNKWYSQSATFLATVASLT